MLFYNNLNDIVFHRNELFRCDELVILSGYVGPAPVHSLGELPLKTTVVYGMYGSDGIQKSLHSALVHEDNTLDNVSVYYSTMPVHAKCYIWKHKGEVVHALVGSANFSTNGLTTPYKEVLAETTADTFNPLDQYLKTVLDKAISCKDATPKNNTSRRGGIVPGTYDPNVCSMPLFIIKNGQKTIPLASGINWGLAKLKGSHVNINDAYVRIGADLLEHYPILFPMKQKEPSNKENAGRKNHRHNDSIDIIWDDGTTMTGLLEGSVLKEVNGIKVPFPKQISTVPKKSILGEYLRKRLSVPTGKAITMLDLKRYGRDTIDVSLQGEGIYYFDFSVGVQGASAGSSINVDYVSLLQKQDPLPLVADEPPKND